MVCSTDPSPFLSAYSKRTSSVSVYPTYQGIERAKLCRCKENASKLCPLIFLEIVNYGQLNNDQHFKFLTPFFKWQQDIIFIWTLLDYLQEKNCATAWQWNTLYCRGSLLKFLVVSGNNQSLFSTWKSLMFTRCSGTAVCKSHQFFWGWARLLYKQYVADQTTNTTPLHV